MTPFSLFESQTSPPWILLLLRLLYQQILGGIPKVCSMQAFKFFISLWFLSTVPIDLKEFIYPKHLLAWLSDYFTNRNKSTKLGQKIWHVIPEPFKKQSSFVACFQHALNFCQWVLLISHLNTLAMFSFTRYLELRSSRIFPKTCLPLTIVLFVLV